MHAYENRNFYAQFSTDVLLVGRGRFAGERDVDVGVVLVVGRGGQEEVVRRHVTAVIERITPSLASASDL